MTTKVNPITKRSFSKTQQIKQNNNNNNNKNPLRNKLKLNQSQIKTQSNKLPALKNQTTNRLANTLIGKPDRKISLDESEKENDNPQAFNHMGVQKLSLKEMVEQASVEQRALSMIEDTLYLFNNNITGKNTGTEKYELINKDEFEQIKNNNEKLRKQENELKEEFVKLKDEYEKVSNELNNHNYKYYNTEKAKTDSITKLYSMETELKKMIVSNSKLQNEIQKQNEGKNNIFRALNEFKRKYEKEMGPELKEIFAKIKDDKFNPVNGVPKSDKIGYLEEKLESLKKDVEDKEKIIQQLKKKIKEINQ